MWCVCVWYAGSTLSALTAPSHRTTTHTAHHSAPPSPRTPPPPHPPLSLPLLPSSQAAPSPAPVTIVRTTPGHHVGGEQQQLLGDQPPTNTAIPPVSGADMDQQLHSQQLNFSSAGPLVSGVAPIGAGTTTPYRMTNTQFATATSPARLQGSPVGQLSSVPSAGQSLLSGQQLRFQSPGSLGSRSVVAPVQASMHSAPLQPLSTAAAAQLPPSSFPGSSNPSSMLPFLPTASPGTQGAVPISSHHSIPMAATAGGAHPGVLASSSLPPASSLALTDPTIGGQTVSGLPSAPPTISFPSIAPKISLQPTSPAAGASIPSSMAVS